MEKRKGKQYREYSKTDVGAMLRAADLKEVQEYAAAAFCNEKFCKDAGGDVPNYLKELAQEGKRFAMKSYDELLTWCFYLEIVNAYDTDNLKAIYFRNRLTTYLINSFVLSLEHATTLARLQDEAPDDAEGVRRILKQHATDKLCRPSGDEGRPLTLNTEEVIESLETYLKNLYYVSNETHAIYCAQMMTAQYFKVSQFMKKELKERLNDLEAQIAKSYRLMEGALNFIYTNDAKFTQEQLQRAAVARIQLDGLLIMPLKEETFNAIVENVVKNASQSKHFNAENYKLNINVAAGNNYFKLMYAQRPKHVAILKKQSNT